MEGERGSDGGYRLEHGRGLEGESGAHCTGRVRIRWERGVSPRHARFDAKKRPCMRGVMLVICASSLEPPVSWVCATGREGGMREEAGPPRRAPSIRSASREGAAEHRKFAPLKLAKFLAPLKLGAGRRNMAGRKASVQGLGARAGPPARGRHVRAQATCDALEAAPRACRARSARLRRHVAGRHVAARAEQTRGAATAQRQCHMMSCARASAPRSPLSQRGPRRLRAQGRARGCPPRWAAQVLARIEKTRSCLRRVQKRGRVLPPLL